MSNLKNGAREAFESLKGKASGWMDTASDVVDNLKDKAAPTVDNLKDKASDAVDNLKDKASDVVDNLKDKASDVVDFIRDAVSDKPVEPKNEMFEGLEEEAKQQQADARLAAEEMQRKLEKLLCGEKDHGATDPEEPGHDTQE